jgi:MFS family permease
VTGWLAPQIIDGAARRFGSGAAEAGLLVMVEGIVAGFLSMALGARPPKVGMQKVCTGALLLYMTANGLSLLAPGLAWLVIARLVSGVACGTLIFASIALVARTDRPDRGFAVINVASTIYGAALLMLPPLLLPQAQGLGYLALCAGAALVLAPFLFAIPGEAPAAAGRPLESAIDLPRRKRPQTIFVLLMVMAVALTLQMLATLIFSIGVGRRIGMGESEINSLMGLSILLSTVMPFAAVAIGRKLPKWSLFLFIGVAAFAANLLLVQTGDANLYRACMIANVALAAMYKPLLPTWGVEIDPSGRASSMMMGLFFVVGAITPVAVGWLVDRGGLDMLVPVVAGSGSIVIIALGFIAVHEVREKRLSRTG